VQARRAIEALQTALRNRGDSEKVIDMATAIAVERFHIEETETERRIMPPVQLTMTGPEIKTVLYDESNRLRKLENAAQAELKTIPEKREAIVTDLCYKHVPEWYKHDEKTAKLGKNDKQCQERETAWLQAQKNNGWKYLPPLPPEAGAIEQFKRKAVYTLMSEKQFAWQQEGASLKEWRPRIDTAKASLEQERQKLQTKTNGLAPQINSEADKLMTRRAELKTQQNQAYDGQVRIREVSDKCPKGNKKGDKAFDVTGRDAFSIMADQNLHKQLKKEKELVQALDRGKGMGR
jgi:predicted  nucleic acid-binding Zn-ribbon protein